MISPLCPFEACRRYKIFERVEKNDTNEWNYFGYFGDKEYEMSFPTVIQPIENGKFILFPQETKPVKSGFVISVSSLNLEVWERNRTFIRSLLEFPIDFPNYFENLWVLQM